MTKLEAIQLLIYNKSGAVKHGKISGWSEYSIQYIIGHRTGELSWTAGMTVGGLQKVTEQRFNGEEEGWFYFTRWGDDTSIIQ